MLIKLSFICCFLCFSVIKNFANPSDSIHKKTHFELSFGQSLLFISDGQQNKLFTQNSVVVPTSALLFLAEFRPEKKMRIPVFVNIATETKQYLVNGQLIYQRAAPTLGAGLQFGVLKYEFDENSRLEFEVGPLASILVDSKDKFRIAPVLAARFKIMRGENFTMYFGGSYSLGINALGILYGTGTIF